MVVPSAIAFLTFTHAAQAITTVYLSVRPFVRLFVCHSLLTRELQELGLGDGFWRGWWWQKITIFCMEHIFEHTISCKHNFFANNILRI